MLRLEFLIGSVQCPLSLNLTLHPCTLYVVYISLLGYPLPLPSVPFFCTMLSPLNCLQHTCHWKVSAKVITSLLSRVVYLLLLPLTHPSRDFGAMNLLSKCEAHHQAAFHCLATVRLLFILPPGEKSACQSRLHNGAVHS